MSKKRKLEAEDSNDDNSDKIDSKRGKMMKKTETIDDSKLDEKKVDENNDDMQVYLKFCKREFLDGYKHQEYYYEHEIEEYTKRIQERQAKIQKFRENLEKTRLGYDQLMQLDDSNSMILTHANTRSEIYRPEYSVKDIKDQARIFAQMKKDGINIRDLDVLFLAVNNVIHQYDHNDIAIPRELDWFLLKYADAILKTVVMDELTARIEKLQDDAVE